MHVEQLDHLVLTVADIDASVAFYSRVLGMSVVTFGEGRTALSFGTQKINLHRHGAEFQPHARRPTPGSADLCFIAVTPLDEVINTLSNNSIAIVEGPVMRTGATGPIRSVYVRDPDGNLVEIANRITG